VSRVTGQPGALGLSPSRFIEYSGAGQLGRAGMSQEQVKRRLTAILAADLVGYSRLMEVDEEKTLFELHRHRRELFDPATSKHGGHIFKTMGDGFLVEFGSVLAAARCAIEIQRGLMERNIGVPDDRQFRFRIGLNIGDIIVEGDDFYGDGVNMAVRLQGMAPPGGIACSGAVHQELRNKVEVKFADFGMKSMKNMTRPVHVYLASTASIAPAPVIEVSAPAKADLAIEKPSIAVLPFANLSNDPEQEFFSDGVTEDIITDLSNVSGLFVLSRNTVFAYKNRARTLERIARELGVAYVVQGSVRKSGNRVRINAELVEGATDGHLWAARYDRDISDIFALQDELTTTIIEQLKVKLLPDEKKAIAQTPTANVEAYTHYLRGREYYHIASKANHLMARQSFARAI
jgi:adenylate cyclase